MKKTKKKYCDMCFEESIIDFGITSDAVFHSCEKHAGALSNLIYPIGDGLAMRKLPLMFGALKESIK